MFCQVAGQVTVPPSPSGWVRMGAAAGDQVSAEERGLQTDCKRAREDTEGSGRSGLSAALPASGPTA